MERIILIDDCRLKKLEIINTPINIASLNDKLIIEKYNESEDKSLVGELFKRYTDFVFLVSMKYLKNEERSKDAVMQIFEKLFSDLLKHNIENFKPWLHMVVRNHCLGLLRKDQSIKKNEKSLKLEFDFMELEEEDHLNNESEYENDVDNLKNALKQLKIEQKKCVELFYLEEKSYNEITALTGYPIKKVKSYIQNGKRNLKLMMQRMANTGLYILLYWVFKNWG
ncbi:MAG: sigma-70 family RNA polymerase sigma factor [Bacteroidota bacterium]